MYDYQKEREKLFTEKAQPVFLQVRDKATALLSKSGAVALGSVITNINGGDTWLLMACVDRLVELSEIREVPQTGVRGQDRIFVKKD